MNIPEINLEDISEQLSRLSIDAQRIGLFQAAISKKALELSTSEPLKLPGFLLDSSDLIGRWIDRVHKLNIGDLLGDPFEKLRKETREFAKEWELDPVFVKLMG